MKSLRTSIVRHTLPDSTHHDWFLEPPANWQEQRLISFRLASPPSLWRCAQVITLEMMPPHRKSYLDYQGDISGNRGRVTPISQGHYEWLLHESHNWQLRLWLDAWQGDVTLAHKHLNWQMHCAPLQNKSRQGSYP